MKRTLLTIVLAVLTALCAEAQPMARLKASLMEADSLTGARVTTAEYGEAAEAVAKYDAQRSPATTMQGYRIRIYSGNHQSARAEAEEAKALFEEHYAVPTYFTYENPYFLVTCGNCLTQEEAMMLLRSVRVHFPKAFIVMAEIPTVLFLTRPAPKPTEGEDGTAEGVATEEATTTPNEDTSAPTTNEVVTPATEPSANQQAGSPVEGE